MHSIDKKIVSRENYCKFLSRKRSSRYLKIKLKNMKGHGKMFKDYHCFRKENAMCFLFTSMSGSIQITKSYFSADNKFTFSSLSWPCKVNFSRSKFFLIASKLFRALFRISLSLKYQMCIVRQLMQWLTKVLWGEHCTITSMKIKIFDHCPRMARSGPL